MSAFRLIAAELRHTKVAAALFICVAGGAVACALVLEQLSLAAENETRVVQRDIGLNLVLLPPDADPGDYWMGEETPASLSSKSLSKLEGQAVAARLVPMLKRRARVAAVPGPDRESGDAAEGTSVLVVGIGRELSGAGKPKAPRFSKGQDAGVAVLGSQVARRLGVQAGDSVLVAGAVVPVERVLVEAGNVEDASLYLDLATAQGLLGLPEAISEIQALECHCGALVSDPLSWLREELGAVLPGIQVLRRRDAADARRQARLAAARVVRRAGPLAMLAAGLLVGLLAWWNVRNRRAEIAAWNALGMPRERLLALVLGRFALLGLAGALTGWLLAAWLGPVLAEEWFPKMGAKGLLPYSLGRLVLVLLIGAGVAGGAVLLPVAIALGRDPAKELARG